MATSRMVLPRLPGSQLPSSGSPSSRKGGEDEEEGQDPPNIGRIGQRSKVSTACEECKRRRRKCDGQKPSCAPCLKRGIECRYDEMGDRRRARVFTAQEFQAVNEKALRYERMLWALQNSPEEVALQLFQRLRSSRSRNPSASQSSQPSATDIDSVMAGTSDRWSGETESPLGLTISPLSGQDTVRRTNTQSASTTMADDPRVPTMDRIDEQFDAGVLHSTNFSFESSEDLQQDFEYDNPRTGPSRDVAYSASGYPGESTFVVQICG